MDHFVIAITRTCGSGATSIGRILAKNLGVELYDRNILRLASDDSGISEELFARADEDQKQSLLFRASQKVYTGGLIPPEKEDFTSNNNLFNYQAKVPVYCLPLYHIGFSSGYLPLYGLTLPQQRMVL